MECKGHLSLEVAGAAVPDGKLIIYLCKFVILGGRLEKKRRDNEPWNI